MKLFDIFKKNKLSYLESEQLKKYPEKIEIVNFNKKWAGKEAYYCDWFDKWIVLSYEDITFCCEGRPIKSLKPYNEEPISLSKYMQKLDEVLEDMQKDNNPCTGCKQLIKKRIPKYKLSKQIKSFSISHYTKCHLRCAYCFIPYKNLDFKNDMEYDAMDIINYLDNMDMLSDNFEIGWGGGEPTISKYFDKNISEMLEKGYNIFINTTAVKFSDSIYNGMKQKKLSIQVSVDSGTSETYKKVKGVDHFDNVWNNIKKYADFPDNIRIKYILFDWNSNEKDISGFIDKCLWAGIKNITVSPEMTAENSYPIPAKNWKMNDKNVTNMAALIKYLAIKNSINIEPYIGVDWTEKHLKDIDEEFKILSNRGKNNEI